MTRYAHSLLHVQLQLGGGYNLAVVGPERQASLQTLQQRLTSLQPFLDLAAAELTALGHPQACFAVQLHDEAPEPACFRFDGPLDRSNPTAGPLIPDPYALGSHGFAALRQQFTQQPLPAWRERLPIAIWRGSSTGTTELTANSLDNNRRYQLCQASQRLHSWLDARLTAVVQCPDSDSRRKVTDKLVQQDLLAPRLSPWHLALHRWLIEIDGNVNSWGLLWKLLSGSCVLRVASNRAQWYHHRLQPWQHIVPIAADLSDLEDVVAWCQRHPTHCEAIAYAGQCVALEVVDQLAADQRQAVHHYAANWLRTWSA